MTEEEVFRRYGQPLTIPILQELGGALLFVAKAPPCELLWLDKRVREVSSYRSRDLPPWPQIGADELDRILRSPEPAVHLLGLISFHQSGHLRELAVRRLSRINSGKELPFLLLRLNDWVTPVYAAASSAVQARVIPEYAEAFVDNIELVFGLADRRRRDSGPLVAAIKALLKQPVCDAALRRGMASFDRNVRRLCFRALEEADDERLPEVVRLRLTDADQAIRWVAARIVRTKLTNAVLRAFFPMMRQDSSLGVRREALYAYLERLPELAPAELRAALLDTNAAMREIARYHLRQSDDFDVPAFYREALRASATPSELATAIGGLGETGTAVDAGLILPYLSHTLARVRRATVRAVSKLDGDNQIEALFAALADERPSVAHEAREALRPRLALLDDGALWRLFKTAAQLHVRRDVLALLASLPKWDSIPFLVEATADGEAQVREQAEKCVRNWKLVYNHSFAKPTSAQLKRLDEALWFPPDVYLEALVHDWKAKGTA